MAFRRSAACVLRHLKIEHSASWAYARNDNVGWVLCTHAVVSIRGVCGSIATRTNEIGGRPMKTGDEGQVCSECGIYIPRGDDAVMAGGGRVLCAECTRKEAKKQASTSGVGAQQQQVVGAPAEQHGAAGVLCILLVAMAVLSGLAAGLAGALLASGSPSAPYIFASGVVGCLLWAWMAAVLRVLLDIHKRMTAA
jgi:hypothetical protein